MACDVCVGEGTSVSTRLTGLRYLSSVATHNAPLDFPGGNVLIESAPAEKTPAEQAMTETEEANA